MTRTWTQKDGMRFLYLALAFTVLLAALVVLPPALPAQAANSLGGAMEVGDGDTTGPNDWTTTPGILVINDADQTLIPAAGVDSNGIITAVPNEICSADNDLSLAGSKINTPSVTIDPDGSDGYPTPQPTGKTDLCQLYLGFEDTGSKIILNVGVVKYKSQGDLSVFIELSQGSGVVAASFRQVGDVLLEFDWGGGSGEADPVVQYEWDGSEWILSPGALPVDGGSAAPNRVFGEAAVDISSLFPSPTDPDSCERFGAATLWGKTGNSLTASLKDVIGPGPIDLSNCGTLIVEKETIPAAATGTFLYSIDSTDYQAWDPTDPDGTTDPTLTQDGDSDTYLLLPGEYTVAELTANLAAQGFDASSYTIDCGDGPGDDVADVVVGETETCTIKNVKFPTLTLEKTVVNDNGGTAVEGDFQASVSGSDVDWDATTVLTVGSFTAAETTLSGYAASAWGGDCAGDGSITLTMGQNATCTITNNDIAPTLVLEKTVINDDGGTAVEDDFQASVSSNDVDWDAVTALSAGSYTAAETTLAGYTASVWGGDCAADGSITLGLGDTATCTITNDDIAPKLTLVKVLDIHWGGDAALADFLLSADGPVDISGTTGQAAVTAAEVLAGTYALDENGPAGYLGQGWACIGGSQNGSDITLAVGQEATCTVTNADEPGQIIVVKQVINDDGGTLGAGDFTLTLDDTEVVSGGVNNVFTDVSHTATETNIPSGYEWVSTSCVITGTDTPIGTGGVLTVSEGQSATCTIVNDDIAPTLVLEKTVVNDAGGTAVEDDFQASVSSNDVDWDAVTALLAGSYTAAETTLPGYAASVWGGDCAEDGSITLSLGDTATCTITNDDIAPTLVLEKTVVNDDGGTATEDDFQASVGGGDVDWDAVTALSAGSYTAAEETLAGYAASVWGGDCAEDGSITLSLGDTATCTITNDDIAPTLTLVKEVVNDDGGTASATDWTLSANDGGDGADLLGVTGTTDVTGNVLANAAYALGETGGPDGYGTTGYACVGEGITSSNASSVTLALDADVTCTIVNDDLGSSITVVKEFENETEVDPDAFGLTVTEGDAVTPVLSGIPNDFNANLTYEVGETVLDGWTQTSLVCRDGEDVIDHPFELAPDQHVVCTITNGENPTVTVEKVTDIPTEDLFDFVLNEDTQAVASGGSYTWENLFPGEYTLIENLTSEAWELEGYECNVQAEDLGNGVGFGLSWGDHVTCVFGNDIAPIDIQVVKTDRVDPIILSDDNPVGLIEYDIVVTNNGPAADPQVTAVDTLPPSLTFVSVVTDVGSCAYVALDHTIECDFGAMEPGDEVNIYVVMQTETLGSVTEIFPFNEVTVTGIREDINLDNNTDDEVTTIIEVEVLCDEDDDDPECLPETGADFEGPVAAGLAFLLFGSLMAVLARKEDKEGSTA